MIWDLMSFLARDDLVLLLDLVEEALHEQGSKGKMKPS